MLKAILFDLDNTLLDFSGFKRATALAAAKAIRQAGVPKPEKWLYDRIFDVYSKKGIEYQRTFTDLLTELEIDPHTYEHARQAAIIAYQKKKYELIHPHPKVIQTLNSLKGKYKLGIVTDAPRENAWQRLILAGLDHYFYPVVTFNDTRNHKPSDKPFRRALDLLKLKPEEVLYVGDSPERDILGAKKLGIRTCLAKYGCIGYTEELDVADYAIEKIEEVKAVISSIE